MPPEPVRLRFSKFGLLDDPRGGHAVFTLGKRDYLVEVTDVFRTQDTGYRGSSLMLRTRHLNGEAGPDVSPYQVKMLIRTYERSPIYSVSFMVTEHDDGGCCSFEDQAKRDETAAWMRSEGYYHVAEWQSA